MSTGTFLNSSFTAHKHKTLCEKKKYTNTDLFLFIKKNDKSSPQSKSNPLVLDS